MPLLPECALRTMEFRSKKRACLPPSLANQIGFVQRVELRCIYCSNIVAGTRGAVGSACLTKSQRYRVRYPVQHMRSRILIDQEIFSTVIQKPPPHSYPFPLIQEGQLSVAGESMGT